MRFYAHTYITAVAAAYDAAIAKSPIFKSRRLRCQVVRPTRVRLVFEVEAEGRIGQIQSPRVTQLLRCS